MIARALLVSRYFNSKLLLNCFLFLNLFGINSYFWNKLTQKNTKGVNPMPIYILTALGNIFISLNL